MSFFGVQEIIENSNYLSALHQEQWACTDIINNLPAYDDPKVRSAEERLRSKGALRFETIFNEETGYYLFERFLAERMGKEKAMFLRDVDAYMHMRFEAARLKVAQLIFERYMTEKGTEMHLSVFDAIKMRSSQKQRERSGSTSQVVVLDSGPSAAVSVAAQSGSFRDNRSRGGDAKDPSSRAADEDASEADVVTPRNLGSQVSDDEDGNGQPSPNDDRASNASARSGGPGSVKITRRPSERQGSGRQLSTSKSPAPSPSKGERGSVTGTPAKANGRGSVGETKIDEDGEVTYKESTGPMVKPPENFTEQGAATNSLEIPIDFIREVSRQISKGTASRTLFNDIAREVRQVLIREAFPAFLNSIQYQKYVQTKHLEEAQCGPDEFTILRVLGRGGFGTVYACRKNDSGKLYAMKAISKRVIKYKKAVSMTMLERHCLALVHSRFVCNLCYAFQDRTHLYLIMDLMTGGDLKYHLTKNRNGVVAGFPEPRARFHAAEILLGLESMHTKSIIFRDLKLENVLLDDQGHCKLTDLGLVALYGRKKITHYAGTPGYIAPEVTKKEPYGPAVDLFSFGVTVYRMLSGRKPFRGHTRQDFDRSVCQDEPLYDSSMFSPAAISLLKGLLQKDPTRRLGATKEGIQMVKNHPFFEEIDWGLLEIGYLEPPFVPSKNDVNANSVQDIGVEDPDEHKWADVHLDDKFRKQIHGFDYVSKTAVRKEIVAALSKQEQDEANKAKEAAKAGSQSKCCVIL